MTQRGHSFILGGKMKKIIKIDGKDYTMASSAYTQFAYKNLTGRSLIKDLDKLIKLSSKQEKDLTLLDELTEPLTDMAFIMIQEADSTQVSNKEEFLKGIENLYDDNEWGVQVIELAVNPLSRQLQGNTNNK